MSSEWHPDDSLGDRDNKGELKGVAAIKAALRKNKVRLGTGVITSRDPGIAKVTRDLKRSGLPDRVEQWLLPVIIGPSEGVLYFRSQLKAGAIVPTHSHKHSVFRIVISGELKFGRKTLKAGDWMYVPAGVDYAIAAGTPQPLKIFYMHP
ncbi:MAG TPA: cupin domain-containing protein [Candidatus Dormibacteraeota bacterium]